jgi:hypothetical protein
VACLHFLDPAQHRAQESIRVCVIRGAEAGEHDVQGQKRISGRALGARLYNACCGVVGDYLNGDFLS